MRLFSLLILMVFFIACDNEVNNKTKLTSTDKVTVDLIQNPNSLRDDDGKALMPILTFDKSEHDFGELIQGEVVRYIFTFKNTGEAPLIIDNCKATCGCTVPKWPTKPLQVGEEAEIEVVFDSKGKLGAFNKTIKVTANTLPNVTKINITGNIKLN